MPVAASYIESRLATTQVTSPGQPPGEYGVYGVSVQERERKRERERERKRARER